MPYCGRGRIWDAADDAGLRSSSPDASAYITFIGRPGVATGLLATLLLQSSYFVVYEISSSFLITYLGLAPAHATFVLVVLGVTGIAGNVAGSFGA